jgi:hypothetical protein
MLAGQVVGKRADWLRDLGGGNLTRGGRPGPTGNLTSATVSCARNERMDDVHQHNAASDDGARELTGRVA